MNIKRKPFILNLSTKEQKKLNILAHKNYMSMTGYIRHLIEINYEECENKKLGD